MHDFWSYEEMATHNMRLSITNYFGNTKIDQLYNSMFVYHDIFGFNISVNNPILLQMSQSQSQLENPKEKHFFIRNWIALVNCFTFNVLQDNAQSLKGIESKAKALDNVGVFETSKRIYLIQDVSERVLEWDVHLHSAPCTFLHA